MSLRTASSSCYGNSWNISAPERRIVVARELTKHYEEIARGTTSSLLEKWQERSVRGEFTVIVDGCQ